MALQYNSKQGFDKDMENRKQGRRGGGPTVRVVARDRRTMDGITFDSKLEMERYIVLKAMKEAGEISELCFHIHIYKLEVDDILIGTYEPDFVYNKDGNRVVEDVKPKYKGAKRTIAYRIFEMKKRLMLALYGIEVQEV